MLVPKMVLKMTLQMAKKRVPNRCSIFKQISSPNLTILGPQNGPKNRSKIGLGATRQPRGPQEYPRRPPRGPRMPAQKVPRQIPSTTSHKPTRLPAH